MQQTCASRIMAVAVLCVVAGCGTPAPPKKVSAWGPPGGRKSATWALKCDSCGKIYAQHTHRIRVPLARHRKWASKQGYEAVFVGEKIHDVCSVECRQKIEKTKSSDNVKQE
jgi:hypothetical protein